MRRAVNTLSVVLIETPYELIFILNTLIPRVMFGMGWGGVG